MSRGLGGWLRELGRKYDERRGGGGATSFLHHLLFSRGKMTCELGPGRPGKEERDRKTPPSLLMHSNLALLFPPFPASECRKGRREKGMDGRVGKWKVFFLRSPRGSGGGGGGSFDGWGSGHTLCSTTLWNRVCGEEGGGGSDGRKKCSQASLALRPEFGILWREVFFGNLSSLPLPSPVVTWRRKERGGRGETSQLRTSLSA